MDYRNYYFSAEDKGSKHLRTVISKAYIHTVSSPIGRIHLSILKDMLVPSRSSRTQDLVPFRHRDKHITKDIPKEIIC
jgi:hypothetical protein